MSKTFISLLITCIVSTLIGLLTSKFIIGFALAFLLQFIIFYIGNTVYNNYVISKIEEIKLQQIKETQKRHTTLACPCSESNRQTVNITMESDVIYKCDKCEKNIKAVHDIKNFITTQPIYFHDRSTKDND